MSTKVFSFFFDFVTRTAYISEEVSSFFYLLFFFSRVIRSSGQVGLLLSNSYIYFYFFVLFLPFLPFGSVFSSSFFVLLLVFSFSFFLAFSFYTDFYDSVSQFIGPPFFYFFARSTFFLAFFCFPFGLPFTQFSNYCFSSCST